MKVLGGIFMVSGAAITASLAIKLGCTPEQPEPGQVYGSDRSKNQVC